jgi:hypothetical protein
MNARIHEYSWTFVFFVKLRVMLDGNASGWGPDEIDD